MRIIQGRRTPQQMELGFALAIARRLRARCVAAQVSSHARAVCSVLFEHSNPEDRWHSWPGQSVICNETALSESAVRRGLRELEKAELISTKRRKGGNPQRREYWIRALWPVASSGAVALGVGKNLDRSNRPDDRSNRPDDRSNRPDPEGMVPEDKKSQNGTAAARVDVQTARELVGNVRRNAPVYAGAGRR